MGQSRLMRRGDCFEGWSLLCIAPVNGMPTAIFEKHVSHRGALAYVNAQGLVAYIPKGIGQLSNIRPRPIHTPHGVEFVRSTSFKPGHPDITGQYILNSAEDPCFENVAALGAEYIGWTLVANEEVGPQGTLYLDAAGKSRQGRQLFSEDPLTLVPAEAREVPGLWAPDLLGPLFSPSSRAVLAPEIYEYVPGYSKRTLLGAYLPVADIGVWNPIHDAGYEVMLVMPPGEKAKPIGRLRYRVSKDTVAQLRSDEDKLKNDPDLRSVTSLLGDDAASSPQPLVVTEDGQTYYETYWNGTADSFFTALAATWNRWRGFHEQAMQVDIPDEWLRDAALAGLTLSRCSYRGLEPTYQIGEGRYTAFLKPQDCAKGDNCRDVAYSAAIFPVAHYEFVWAHQLWNHVREADRYFQHYLDNYILPNGEFVFNTQDQVEAPLNIGVFLANSARAYLYGRDLDAFEKRLPILERMIRMALDRYEYSKTRFTAGDRRHGLIWGSPEADLGSPRKDGPEDHPYYYRNAAWIWRGLVEHARALSKASEDSNRQNFAVSARHYREVANEMRALIATSLASVQASGNFQMKTGVISRFRTDDIERPATYLTNYENRRFMEDWFLADWGDPALDLGHLKHRDLPGRKTMGLGLSHSPSVTSNFMAHGTLSVLIRQADYRPFLLSLYALTCYAADSGNRYSPEDAFIPGGHPLEGPAGLWSAVVNSTLQPTLGLRWLLCYEESNNDICHLQKAAPKHWFAKGQSISVKNCPTRFGSISWSTRAVEERQWKVTVEVPKGFATISPCARHRSGACNVTGTTFPDPLLLTRHHCVSSCRKRAAA